MHQSIQRAIQENRLKFFSNGSYSYIPSKEYMEKFVYKEPIRFSETKIRAVKSATLTLDSVIKGKNVAQVKGKKLSHIKNGQFIFS
jgi:hypothetical protein